MAQTAPKLTLEDSTGNRISTPGIKTFAIGTDNNLVIYLDQAFNFTALSPDISVDGTAGTYSKCTVSAPATVTATKPAAGTSLVITFKVTSATATTFTMPVPPEPVTSLPTSPKFTSPTFSWDIGGATPAAIGSYLAVFQATDGTNTSQLVVMINITAPGYTLTVNTVGSGTVTKNPDQATYTTSPVQNVQLTPNPGSGYSFSGWSGDDLSGSANPANIVMNGNKTVTATFAQTPATLYTLTVTVSPSSSAGTVSLNPSGGSYTAGTQVTLTATANSNYTFSSWSNVDSSSGTTAYVSMPSNNKTVTANFTYSGGGGTPPNYPKLNQIAPTSGDWYGGTVSVGVGETKGFILPVGEVYPGKNIRFLDVEAAAVLDRTGQVNVKLTSPDTPPWTSSGQSSTGDFSFSVMPQSYPGQTNYPYTYVNNGYWILEITGVLNSSLKVWWKCYY